MLGRATTRLILGESSFFSVGPLAMEIRFWSVRIFELSISCKKLKSLIGGLSGSNGMISICKDLFLLLSLLEFSDRIGSDSLTARLVWGFVS